MLKNSLAFLLLFCSVYAHAQPERWQQRVSYEMNIDMDVVKNQYRGVQHLTYTNNSPDTLDKVFITCISMLSSPAA